MEPDFDPCDAIARHCEGIAEVAADNLWAPVEHCPEWRVGDLLRHLVDVHWYWATIVAERLDAPPGEARRPSPPDDRGVIAAFLAGAERMVGVLRTAPGTAHVWTWAPGQQDIAFVRRHQVQEAAVHHWDAAHAAHHRLAIPAREAADAVDEFLTFSVSSDTDPATPARPALDGCFSLVATDQPAAWTVADGDAAGTVRITSGQAEGVPAVAAPSSDLVLWLYGRVPLDTSGLDPALLARFHALCFTD